ncbi:putative tail fiber protein [Nitrincola phage 1M3-16]|uniref:central tail fiber J n=1 Tax=Nitrincola phage 1M3-16 TaxID=1472912 RepID=UPI000444C38C|nr:central tail fiber J [Nitrincola phage 1M3-16]AHX01182.1 putative tail fiber protein [Nitrincola phage 1M3-16]
MEKQITRLLPSQEHEVAGVDMFSVVYQKAPIMSPDLYKVQQGITLQEVADELVHPLHHDKMQVWVNGNMVKDLSYKPTNKDVVHVCLTPQGAVVPVWALVTAAISFVAGFLLFKPSIPDFTRPEVGENKQLSRIRGARNEARAYDVIPVVLGKRQVVPAYQATPYTEIRGEDEWFKMLLCVGYGPMQIENIRIGDAPITNYEHRMAIVDHYQNTSLSALRQIWPADIVQETVNVPLAFEGTRTIVNRATVAQIDRVSVDFFYPRGIYRINESTGREQSRTVAVMHEYQDPTDNEWVIVAHSGNVPSAALPFVFKTVDGVSYIKGYTGLVNSVVRSGSTARQRRSNITYEVPNVSQAINVRSRKVSPQDTPDDTKLQDSVEWSVLRSIRNTSEQQFLNLIGDKVPPRYIDGQPVKVFRPVIIALEIKATDQLNGIIDNLNVDATMCVPSDWNVDWRDWTNKTLTPSENPADAYRWLLQGPMNASPLRNARLDLEGMLVWRNRNIQDGWKISSLIDYESTLLKELGQVAFTGRAEFGFIDGRYGVVEKIARYTPVQIFTPKNSRDFSSARTYPEVTDGIKFQFDNREKDYQKDEDIFYDLTIPTNERRGRFTGVDFWGVADRDLAYKHSRFGYYETKLRREVYKLTTDFEGLRATRGDLVRIQNDVIDVGLGSGRIKAITGNQIVIDEMEGLPSEIAETVFWNNSTILFNSDEVFWNNGDDVVVYGFQIRCSNGTISTITATYLGDNTWGTSDPIPVCADVGDLIVYGEAGRETLDCIVDNIEYQNDLVCVLTLINAANEIFELDDDFIPEFESGLTERPDYKVPTPPEFQVGLAGFDIARGLMYVSIGAVPDINEVTGYQLQVRRVSDDPEITLDWVDYEVPQNASQFVVSDVTRGDTYELRARTIGSNRLFSPFTAISTVEVPEGLPAQQIVGVSFDHTLDGTLIKWDQATDADFQYYELRTNVNFSDDVGLVTRTTSNVFNVGYLLGGQTYYVSAKTRFGVYSNTPTQINVSSPVVGTPTSLDIELIRDKTRITWQTPSSSYPIEDYDVRKNTPQTGTGLENSILLTTIKTTLFEIASEEAGEYVYWVRAKDIAGNISDYVTNQVHILSPSTPTGLVATGLFRSVQLNWDQPTYFGHDFTEIYRSLTNDIGDAVKVGDTTGNYFVDAVDGGDTFYYFIRNISVTGTPSNFSASASVTTPANADVLKQDLLNQIGYDQFDVASGVFPVRLVTELPELPNPLYPVGAIVSLAPHGELFNSTGTTWEGVIADIEDGSITTTKIADDAITTPKIFANAITAGKIAAGAVIADKIGANAVTTDKLDANAVTVEKIVAGAVTADKLDVTELSAITGNMGILTAGKIESQQVDSKNKPLVELDLDNANFSLRSAATGGRLEITDERIDVYDANNVLRVRLGRLD